MNGDTFVNTTYDKRMLTQKLIVHFYSIDKLALRRVFHQML